MEAFFHLTASISYPLMIVLSTMLLPAMIVRFYQGWFQMLLIDLPLFLASRCSISGFYLAAQRALYPKTWKRAVIYLPFVMAVGIGLSVRNAKARARSPVGHAIGIRAHAEIRHRGPIRQRAMWRRNPIAIAPDGCLTSKSRWAAISLATVVYAFQNENYVTIPFLLLFVWGYLYTGVMSLGQGCFERLRFGVGIPEETRSAATGVPGF